jgi:predicted PurR-regulated permease PerM
MQKIEISAKTIIFTVFFLLFLNLLWILRDLLFSLFIGFIIMSTLKPFVNYLEKKNFPRFLAVVIIYLMFLGIFLEILNLIFPPLIEQSIALIKNLPLIIKSLSWQNFGLIDLNSFFQFIPNVTGQFFDLAKGLFSNAIFIITTLFFGFYFLLENALIQKTIIDLFSVEKGKEILNIISKIEKRMSNWFWSEITLMTIVGTMTFIGLNLIGLKYALPLAVLAGLLEAVPNIGPIIATIPMALIGFSQDPVAGFSAIALAFIVQQLENNLIIPLFMKKVVGVNPIITLIALIIGGRLAGVAGVFLAIPITLFGETLIKEIIKIRHKQ